MSSITANVHNINTEEGICLVTIKDGDETIFNKKNIGLELNEDGTANTVWIQNRISSYVSDHKKNKIKKLNSSIFIGNI